jgi:chromosome partitioning protein
MRRFVINNHKGGSGKTTTAVNLGAALAESGRKVLIIDLDPQGSASVWFGLSRVSAGEGLFSPTIQSEEILALAKQTTTQNLSIIPNMSLTHRHSGEVKQKASQGKLLKAKLDALPQNLFDYIILDCSPSLNLVTLNALVAADELLIPIAANYLVLNGVVSLLETVKTVKVKLNSSLHISGVLPCRVDPKVRHTMEVMDLLVDKFGQLVYKSFIREDIRLAECPSFAKTIFQYAPKSMGALDFKSLCEEIISQEGTEEEA